MLFIRNIENSILTSLIMKKLPGKIVIASLLIAINFNLSSAQIFLCENDLPNIGDTAIVIVLDSAEGVLINQGLSGAAQTWNFGLINPVGLGVNEISSYIDPVLAPNIDSFPSADIVANMPWGYDYFIKDPSGLLIIGEEVPSLGEIIHFDSPYNWFPFVSYEDTLDYDSRYWFSISPDSVQVLQSVGQHIADAWGTIVTPAGTTDVIRIFTTETTYDSLFVSGVGQQIGVYTGDYYYRWYAKNLGWPVLEISKTFWDDNVQIVKYASDLSTIPPTPPPPTGIQGQVSYSLGPVIGAGVAIYGWNEEGTQMKVLVDATTTDNFGNYTFTNVQSGEYIIIAEDDALSNSTATYYGGVFYFDSASIVFASCDLVYSNADITLMEYTPSSTGPGAISGNIRWWDGPGKAGAPVGDPVPGLDITIEQIPGGTIKGDTLTDGLGNYSFTNLDIGTYRIYVDMTGYPIDTFHIITISATDTMFTNMDYWASDSSMYIPLPSSIQDIEDDKGINVKVFPNPFSDETRFEISGSDNNQVLNLEIYDIMGRKVDEKDLTKTDLIYFRNEEMGPGLYFYKISTQEGIIGQGKLAVQ